jgi:hypothetical protein
MRLTKPDIIVKMLRATKLNDEPDYQRIVIAELQRKLPEGVLGACARQPCPVSRLSIGSDYPFLCLCSCLSRSFPRMIRISIFFSFRMRLSARLNAPGLYVVHDAATRSDGQTEHQRSWAVPDRNFSQSSQHYFLA